MTGEQLKIEGIERVEGNNYNWVDYMRRKALNHWARYHTVTVDNLRQYDNGWPHNKNAWGAIFRASMGWRCIGRRKSTVPSNHAREVRVWVYDPEGVKE